MRTDLSLNEKQYLIDATMYHGLLDEYYHLNTLRSLIAAHPGTRNRLVLLKTRSQKLNGKVDESEVDEILLSTPGFLDFLKHHDFDFYARYPFVDGLVREYQQKVFASLVVCPECLDQYLILPPDYYFKIGV